MRVVLASEQTLALPGRVPGRVWHARGRRTRRCTRVFQSRATRTSPQQTFTAAPFRPYAVPRSPTSSSRLANEYNRRSTKQHRKKPTQEGLENLREWSTQEGERVAAAAPARVLYATKRQTTRQKPRHVTQPPRYGAVVGVRHTFEQNRDQVVANAHAPENGR